MGVGPICRWEEAVSCFGHGKHRLPGNLAMVGSSGINKG